MEKMHETKTEFSSNFVAIDLELFFEMISYTQNGGLMAGLLEYLCQHRCDKIVMDSEAVVLFKKFIEANKQAALPESFKARDWCPCVKDAQ